MVVASRIGRATMCAALALPVLAGGGARAASTLTRTDRPVVLSGASVGAVGGIAPADLVAFAHDGTGWAQIPVQVDERHAMNIRNAYPPGNLNPCSDPCYQPGTRVVNQTVYSDPKTYAGADPDATLDANDEVVFMVKDAGARAPSEAASPPGVLGAGVELAVSDPLDGGTGYAYLFARDASASTPLDPAAGKDYVQYHWDVVHIPDEATQYKALYRFNGHNGTAYVGNPESSWVATAHYRRGMTERWRDNELRVYRGGASGVDFLDRHDASLTYDAPGACIRDQNSFSLGEAAYITSVDGPVRAIRDYLGTNSGPLVQRRHVFYESSEEIRIDLRVHAIPGPQDLWDYNAAATGLEYKHWQPGLPGLRIDGVPDVYATNPLFTPRQYLWESVDRPAVPLPGDPPAQGGVTHVIYYDTNNPDSTSRLLYRDLGAGAINYCNGEGSGASSERARLYGSHAAQTSPVMNSTDGTSTYLRFDRTLHYDAPGTANGPARVQQASAPLTTTATNR